MEGSLLTHQLDTVTLASGAIDASKLGLCRPWQLLVAVGIIIDFALKQTLPCVRLINYCLLPSPHNARRSFVVRREFSHCPVTAVTTSIAHACALRLLHPSPSCEPATSLPVSHRQSSDPRKSIIIYL
jgi:hypothetical protein